MTDHLLASQILQTIQAAPKPGLVMLCTLVEQGKVDLSTPVEPGGLGLMDALLDRALHHGPLGSRLSGNLCQGLFSSEDVDRWLQVSQGKAFSGKDRDDRWIPLAFLLLLEKTAVDGKGKATLKKLPEKKQLDTWLSTVLISLPDQAWQEVGPSLLAKAMQLDLVKSVDVAWSKVSPLSITPEGLPAILSARRAAHWQRFVEDGGDVRHPVDEEPLWKVLLAAVAKAPIRPESSFLGSFERWFVDHAASDPKMHPHVKNLTFARLSRPGQCPPAHWMALFKAAPEDWTGWTFKNNCRLWEVVALAQTGISFFNEMEKHPVLMAQIDYAQFDYLRMQCALRDMDTINLSDLDTAVPQWSALLDEHGWPELGRPYVVPMSKLLLDTNPRKKITSVLQRHQDGLWGADNCRDETEKKLFFLLEKVSRDAKTKMMSWLSFTDTPNPGPWLSVGIGLAWAARGKMEHLQGLNREMLRQVAIDPDAMKLMEDLATRVWTGQRKNYLSWLESAKLEASAEVASGRRSSPRL